MQHVLLGAQISQEAALPIATYELIITSTVAWRALRGLVGTDMHSQSVAVAGSSQQWACRTPGTDACANAFETVPDLLGLE